MHRNQIEASESEMFQVILMNYISGIAEKINEANQKVNTIYNPDVIVTINKVLNEYETMVDNISKEKPIPFDWQGEAHPCVIGRQLNKNTNSNEDECNRQKTLIAQLKEKLSGRKLLLETTKDPTLIRVKAMSQFERNMTLGGMGPFGIPRSHWNAATTQQTPPAQQTSSPADPVENVLALVKKFIDTSDQSAFSTFKNFVNTVTDLFMLQRIVNKLKVVENCSLTELERTRLSLCKNILDMRRVSRNEELYGRSQPSSQSNTNTHRASARKDSGMVTNVRISESVFKDLQGKGVDLSSLFGGILSTGIVSVDSMKDKVTFSVTGNHGETKATYPNCDGLTTHTSASTTPSSQSMKQDHQSGSNSNNNSNDGNTNNTNAKPIANLKVVSTQNLYPSPSGNANQTPGQQSANNQSSQKPDEKSKNDVVKKRKMSQ